MMRLSAAPLAAAAVLAALCRGFTIDGVACGADPELARIMLAVAAGEVIIPRPAAVH